MAGQDLPTTGAPWSATTKLIVGLTLVSLLFGALVAFRPYIAPVTLTVVLAYVLYPVCRWVYRYTPLSWRLSVTVVYLLLLALLSALLVWLGFALVQQVQSLYFELFTFTTQDLPQRLEALSTSVYQFGPFRLDFTRYDWEAVTQQFLAGVQPLLGQVGSVVRVIATHTLSLLGWLLFILLISYFLLTESGPQAFSWMPTDLLPQSVQQDLQRLQDELAHIWHTFLRGQFTAFVVVTILASILLTLLGVRYSLGLAVLVGLARFLPYVGPAIVYVVVGLIVLLQPTNFWGLTPWKHLLLTIGILMAVDQIFDNVVMPRLFGHILGVHPASVLLAAFLLGRFIGLIGFMLAAPVVASGRLLLRYVLYKMVDLDPWSATPLTVQQVEPPWWRRLWERTKRAMVNPPETPENEPPAERDRDAHPSSIPLWRRKP